VSAAARHSEQLARRFELLELQAQLQRVTLAATFSKWEEQRSAFWLGALARLALGLWSTPRVRWVFLAALAQRLLRPLVKRILRRG